MKAGDTFVATAVDTHLWMVITEPALDPDRVVIVNFTSHTDEEEQVCIVNAGEHPFVSRKTAVRYKDARCVKHALLEEGVYKAVLRLQQALSPDLLRRVREGASESEFLPQGCRDILEKQGLI